MPTSQPTLPLLVRARALGGYAALVSELGGDPGALLVAAGLPCPLPSNPEAAISMSATVTLLELTAARLGRPEFGLLLAKRQGIAVLGPIALIASRANNLENALLSIARNLPYHVARTSLVLEREDGSPEAWLRHELPVEAGLDNRQTVEMCCLLVVAMLRMLSGAAGSDWQVKLRHAPGVAAEHYAGFYGCDVQCDQQDTRVGFPAALLALPIDTGNVRIQSAIEGFVAHVIRRDPLDLICQIEELIARQLAGGDCSLATIARQLNFHERTLQRRLNSQQLCFADLLERVRKRQAQEFLCQSALPIAEVASLLGYAEVRSLSRSCQRWFGRAPAAVRMAQPAC